MPTIMPLRLPAQLSAAPAPRSSQSRGGGSRVGATSQGGPTKPIDTLAMHRLLSCLKILREATGNAELQMQTVTMFLYIASRHPNEVPQGEIERVLGMVQTTVSRNCAYLARGSSTGHGGYKLIEVFEDIDYRKRKLVKLTPKGEEVARKIAEVMGH